MLADKEAEKAAEALAAETNLAAQQARKQIEECRKKREQEAEEREAAEKAAAEAKAKAEVEAEKVAMEAEALKRKEKKLEAIEARKVCYIPSNIWGSSKDVLIVRCTMVMQAEKKAEVQARKLEEADKKAMAEIEKTAKMQAIKELRTGQTAQQINAARKVREEAERCVPNCCVQSSRFYHQRYCLLVMSECTNRGNPRTDKS